MDKDCCLDFPNQSTDASHNVSTKLPRCPVTQVRQSISPASSRWNPAHFLPNSTVLRGAARLYQGKVRCPMVDSEWQRTKLTQSNFPVSSVQKEWSMKSVGWCCPVDCWGTGIPKDPKRESTSCQEIQSWEKAKDPNWKAEQVPKRFSQIKIPKIQVEEQYGCRR